MTIFRPLKFSLWGGSWYWSLQKCSSFCPISSQFLWTGVVCYGRDTVQLWCKSPKCFIGIMVKMSVFSMFKTKFSGFLMKWTPACYILLKAKFQVLLESAKTSHSLMQKSYYALNLLFETLGRAFDNMLKEYLLRIMFLWCPLSPRVTTAKLRCKEFMRNNRESVVVV